MGIWRGQYEGNPFLGLYARASEQLCLVPNAAPEKFMKGLAALDVPIAHASVDGSPYVGLYLAFNSNGLVAPPYLNKAEIENLKGLGLKVAILPDSRFSAIANNIACNDMGALVNPEMPMENIHMIEKALGVPVRASPLAGYVTVGAMAVATNKGWLAHNRISEEEASMLDEVFEVKGSNGTLDSGTPFVGMCAVANSRGLVLGERTSGFEEARAMQALDLV